MKDKIKKRKKVCFIASSGGHFEQLLMLKPLMKKYDSFVVTEKTCYKISADVEKMYYLKQINRKELLVLVKMLFNTFRSFYIFVKEMPDVVVTTGVLATIPMCLLAKMFGKKLIYIESFAKVSSPTRTGKLLYKFADRFYVQWKPMLAIYPDAIFLGGIY